MESRLNQDTKFSGGPWVTINNCEGGHNCSQTKCRCNALMIQHSIGKDPTPQAHPTSHHQYPLFSSILPSPLLPIILRFPPLVPTTNPRSLPNPSPCLFEFEVLGCGGKCVSIDSSSGVNVGRIGERICYLSDLFLHRWKGCFEWCTSNRV